MCYNTAIYALTPQGLALAFSLAKKLHQATNIPSKDICVFYLSNLVAPVDKDVLAEQFTSLRELLNKTFSLYSKHIFISATGIAVRSIATHLVSKAKDPAVLVMDQKGTFVISLVSGHIGKANDFTRHVATIMDATPVITTATDVEGVPSIDSLAIEKGLFIENMEAAKKVSASLVAHSKVLLYDPENWLEVQGSENEKYFTKVACDEYALITKKNSDLHTETEKYLSSPSLCSPLIFVTEEVKREHPLILPLRPPVLCVGLGCKRGTKAKVIHEQLCYAFSLRGLSLSSVACIASIEEKTDEAGILEVAATLDVPAVFYPAKKLNSYPVQHISEKCVLTFGIKGVCEPAALAAAGEGGVLLQSKIAGNGVTVAIARLNKHSIVSRK